MVGSQPLASRYREVAVKTANPLQLVVMLYDGAIQSLKEAQEHLVTKDIAARGRCINRSVAIVSELQACLNFSDGGGIAHSLDRLYNYMKHQMFKGNLEMNREPLAEVVTLLENLRSAWSDIALQTQSKPKAREASALKDGTTGGYQVTSLNISG
jgi:flagellar secretion chaperone FliS